ncbi:MAG: 16S rRNA (cytosine(1402)-N(4))-methyltransferase RsmH [Lachnospiraceae bacterium]|nr:16S rRNA (cytosine(1402)-N(4))-methyltransferase RsmH [Lachnospiraceae bacterium]
MAEEVISGLDIKPDGIYVDGTLGGGGHSSLIASRLNNGRLIGLDRDEDAIKAATERLKPFGERVTIVRENYENVKRVLSNLNVEAVDGILLDLGVSSFQLDTEGRGFTYRNEDAPLDMRMDRRDGTTASDIINTYSEEELKRILRDYGEERFAGKIASEIVKRRKDKRIETAGELNSIIRDSIPKKLQKDGHPSKRTYQALRIELNRELTILENTIDDMADLLKPGGRLCIITFHSLEDRIVKLHFKKLQDPCTCPKEFPVCVCGKKSKGKVLTTKPIVPTEEELSENKRSKSAKLRIFVRGDKDGKI